MKITEIDTNNEIEIEASVKTEKLKLKTKVSKILPNGICIEPVRYKDKLLSFEGVPISIWLYREEEKPILWKQCVITNIAFKNKTYQFVMCKQDGIQFNRRGAYRVYIGERGEAQIGAGTVPVDVTVKDVSETGFSIVTDNKFPSIDLLRVRLTFTDDWTDSVISLWGTAVRHEDIENNRVVIGCQMSDAPSNVLRFINRKQREMLAKQRIKERESRFR